MNLNRSSSDSPSQQDRQLCHVEVFGEPNWRQVMTSAIFDSCDYLSRPSYNPDYIEWWHFDDPEDQWRRHFDNPDNGRWRHFDNPFYDSRLRCDLPVWRQWRPMWWHWWPLWYVLSPWLRLSDEKDDKVTNAWLTTQRDNVVNLVWRPMWLLLTTCDDQSDDQNMTPTTLTTMGHYVGQSMLWPVGDPWIFAIFIAKV
jgi:hypothetical protein